GEEFDHEFSLSPPLRRANKKERGPIYALTSILSLWERRTQVAGVLGMQGGRPYAKPQVRVLGLCVSPLLRCPWQQLAMRRRCHSYSQELPAKMARFGSHGFSRLAPVSRWLRSHRRRRPLPGQYRQ